jgi:hypothetical protein
MAEFIRRSKRAASRGINAPKEDDMAECPREADTLARVWPKVRLRPSGDNSRGRGSHHESVVLY